MPTFRTMFPIFPIHFMRRAERGFALTCFVTVASVLTVGCASSREGIQNPDWAQAGSPPPPTRTGMDVEWKETEVPPPPKFDTNKLLSIEMPSYMTSKFGVDPTTIAITGDGIVRYVVVVSNASGGGFNAFYEGVRCASEETKSYARYGSDGWRGTLNPEWKNFSNLRTSYAKELAIQGLCRGHAPRASVSEIVRYIRQPVREPDIPGMQ